MSKRLMNNGELAGFFERMAILSRGGVNHEESLSILRADSDGADERALLDAMLAVASEGRPLHAALDAAGRFPDYAVAMVRVGETAGRLESTLTGLSQYYRRQDAIRRETVNAVTYPAAMLLMMLAVMALMSAKVLPVFRRVLSALGGGVSAASSAALGVSEAVAKYAFIVLAAMAVIAAAAFIINAFPKGRRIISRLTEGLFPRLVADTASSRFASAMSSLLASGLNIDTALDMAAGLAEGRTADRLKKLKAATDNGERFEDALRSCGIMTAADCRLIAIGFRAGSPDEAFAAVAERRAEAAERGLNKITGAVEPALVAALCIIVGAMLLTAILPLTGLFAAMA